MASHEGSFTRETPFIYGTNYALWIIRMRTDLISLRINIWKFVMDGYKSPTIPQFDQDGKKACVNSVKDMNSILCGIRVKIFQFNAL